MTRLEACKKIRQSELITLVKGDQLINYKFIHKFTVKLIVHRKKLGAIFCSTHAPDRPRGIYINRKQALNFIRKYYPRHEASN